VGSQKDKDGQKKKGANFSLLKMSPGLMAEGAGLNLIRGHVPLGE
jgi:hypothetical protein